MSEALTDQAESIGAWERWADVARVREPVFLAAFEHHEFVLNFPGVEIVNNTEPAP